MPFHVARLVLALLGAGLIAWRYRERTARPSRAFSVAVCVVALAGAGTYYAQPRLGWVGYWDLYHYYLGSKYADELGYYKLYGATIAADHDGARMFVDIGKVRDIPTQRYVSREALLRDRDRYTNGFSPARWAAFQRDLSWFQARIAPDTWRGILADRGYHPTPAWDRIGGWITGVVPLEAPGGLHLLLSLDPLLWVLACAALWWAYGPVTLALFVIAWGANPLHLTPLKGAFLRLDWLVALVVACAAYRRQRFALSGACLAYASMMRVFPVVFLGGLLARAAWTAVETRRIAARDARFLAGFAAVAIALFALGCPASRWGAFAEKIALHSSVLSQQRSGLEYLVGLGRPALYWPAAALLAAGFVLAARRMPRAQLLPAGLVPMFIFVSAASYYYAVVSVLVLFFHRRASRRDAWGAAALMGCFVAGAVAAMAQGGAISAEISFLWSLLLLGLSIAVLSPPGR